MQGGRGCIERTPFRGTVQALTEAGEAPGGGSGGEVQEAVAPPVPEIGRGRVASPPSNLPLSGSLANIEAERAVGTQPTSHADQVRSKVDFWGSLENSDFAVNLIQQGLKLPFTDKHKVMKACKVNIEERPASKAKKALLRGEVQSLLNQEVIEKVPKGVRVYENHIFVIKKPSGKLRVIFDMKQLNKFIALPKIRMFKFKYSFNSLLNNNFAVKIDLLVQQEDEN